MIRLLNDRGRALEIGCRAREHVLALHDEQRLLTLLNSRRRQPSCESDNREGCVSDLRVLMITQKVDLDDDVLGFTHVWVNKLAGRAKHLHVLALSVGRHKLHDNVTLYSMGKEQGAGRLRRFVKFHRVVAPLVLRRQVDLVFVHMAPLYTILAAPWTRLARVPMVLWYAHGHVSRTLRIAHRLVERVVSSTREGFRVPSQKLVVVGQGIDTDFFRPTEGSRPKSPFTLLSVGRISPVKDYETLLAAADVLINQRGYRDLQFVLVGGAGTTEQEAYIQHLQALAKARNLEARIQFVGSVPHGRVLGYYQQADAFVSTSRTGSLDKAGLEAMACGLPVLTCNEAFTSILGGFSNRLMFEKGNVNGLVERVLELIKLRSESQAAYGGVLREVVLQEHGVERLMSRIVDVFEEAAGIA
jgi:glycosyltransferase involved in cell wall biosynthesis